MNTIAEDKQQTPVDTQLPSYEDIVNWLVGKFSGLTDIAEQDIDIEQPFADYALDSSVAVSLTAELAKWYGRELSVTILWEFPTIDSLSTALSDGLVE